MCGITDDDFVACGVAAVTGLDGLANASYILTVLAFGCVIAAMTYSIGSLSSCHINPAVSIAGLINKGMRIKDFMGFIIASLQSTLLVLLHGWHGLVLS